eukprot:2308172-Rhodomonas_salina.2
MVWPCSAQRNETGETKKERQRNLDQTSGHLLLTSGCAGEQRMYIGWGKKHTYVMAFSYDVSGPESRHARSGKVRNEP